MSNTFPSSLVKQSHYTMIYHSGSMLGGGNGEYQGGGAIGCKGLGPAFLKTKL